MTLKIGQEAPDFTLPSHLGKNVTLRDLRGKIVVMAFFPFAWTPVCTHQIPAYEADHEKFAALNVQVLGISIDHTHCLRAWADSFGGVNYPLLSDFWPHGEVAKKFGVLKDEGFTERAIFIIDEQGIIRYIDIHDIDDQPNNEILFDEIGKINPEAVHLLATKKTSEQPLPHGGIVMYCTSWCPDCKKARQWLTHHKFDYIEVDVNANSKAARQVREWANGDLITPIFDIDGTIIVDWKENELSRVLQGK